MPPHPPEDWNDVDAWDRYLRSQARGAPRSADDIESLRFAPMVLREGGRLWVPGCGVDPGPALYAALGCRVTVTDISPFAIGWQTALAAKPAARIARDWKAFTDANQLVPTRGSFVARRQDFTRDPPDGGFDVVINCRAFSQLPPDVQRRAARSFERGLRPAGHLIIDTLNVQGDERTILEDSLLEAGFFIPGQEAERWYRDQLAATGIAHVMVLGRPLIPRWDQYPPDEFAACERRDKAILASFRAAYEARVDAAVPEAKRRLADGVTKIAHVLYATG
ncbi:MAG: class I SAM-dependent methyltransferase [Myxococcales bacterium]|nr:class I SAM-dependent methyltransferase [Myxococcales bacterium]MBP6846047.1 class I SAM-dependent methyltransferase [Kofleriaceae bacterium]